MTSKDFSVQYKPDAYRCRLDAILTWPELYPSWLSLWTLQGWTARASWLYRRRVLPRRFR